MTGIRSNFALASLPWEIMELARMRILQDFVRWFPLTLESSQGLTLHASSRAFLSVPSIPHTL